MSLCFAVLIKISIFILVHSYLNRMYEINVPFDDIFDLVSLL